MKNNILVKGLAINDILSTKSLQNMHTQIETGIIYSNLILEDIFEISISSSISTSSSIVFQDINLNIISCRFTFNVIGIDNSNKGIFFNYDYNCIITYKSFNNITSFNLLVLDAYFSKDSTSNINFSLVIALDFSKEDNLNVPIINPLNQESIKSFSSSEISLFFDKEFI